MGVYTPHFNLYKPSVNEVGWGEKVNQNFDIIDEKLFLAGFEKIAEIELTETLTSVLFESLNINNDLFYILFFTAKNTSSNDAEYYLFVNDDTTLENYYSQGLIIAAGGTTAARVNKPLICHATNSSSVFCKVTITKDAFGYFRAFSFANFDTASSVKFEIASVCKTETVDNITSLALQSSQLNGLAGGSKFILFKVRRT